MANRKRKKNKTKKAKSCDAKIREGKLTCLILCLEKLQNLNQLNGWISILILLWCEYYVYQLVVKTTVGT